MEVLLRVYNKWANLYPNKLLNIGKKTKKKRHLRYDSSSFFSPSFQNNESSMQAFETKKKWAPTFHSRSERDWSLPSSNGRSSILSIRGQENWNPTLLPSLLIV